MNCITKEVEMDGLQTRQDTCECKEGYELASGAKFPCVDIGK